MNALDLFTYDEGQTIRAGLDDSGEPWFVATDIAKILGYRMASDMTRRLDEDDRGTRSVRTPSGDQQMTTINEPGLYAAVLGSQVEGAKAFKRWVTHEVLPAIRKHGAYAPAAAEPRELSRLELIDMARDSELGRLKEVEARQAAEARAEVSEQRLDLIERGKGFSIREFHKHYFPDVPDRQIFELLYAKRLLIDQRGARVDRQGRKKPGRQHMHPAAAGKPYFFLDPFIDPHTGDRYYHTRVRPGIPETELVAKLERYGLTGSHHQETA